MLTYLSMQYLSSITFLSLLFSILTTLNQFILYFHVSFFSSSNKFTIGNTDICFLLVCWYVKFEVKA